MIGFNSNATLVILLGQPALRNYRVTRSPGLWSRKPRPRVTTAVKLFLKESPFCSWELTVVLIQTVPYLVYSCLPGSPGSNGCRGTRQKLHWYTLRSGPRQNSAEQTLPSREYSLSRMMVVLSWGQFCSPLGTFWVVPHLRREMLLVSHIEERPEMLLAILCTDSLPLQQRMNTSTGQSLRNPGIGRSKFKMLKCISSVTKSICYNPWNFMTYSSEFDVWVTNQKFRHEN